jgi:leader peptidase (prepilin peptidase) / N-methyltransferase
MFFPLYDLIPLISWVTLQGRCRSCNHPISLLFPFIELITVGIGSLLFYHIDPLYRITYFIFFSGLIITIRTDLEKFLILRLATLWLIPLGLFFSLRGLLPIDFLDSFLGTLFGYSILASISWLFYRLRGIKGLGEGDPELLALIGAFTGIVGCWSTLVIGSLLGSCVGICLLISGKATRTTYLPFGPFLALSAIFYVVYQQQLSTFFWYLG